MGPQLAESVALRRSPQREQLLSAAARASRVLLEASDVMAVMPAVLRELGEAAGVDRTALAVVEQDVTGARWLAQNGARPQARALLDAHRERDRRIAGELAAMLLADGDFAGAGSIASSALA